MSGSVSLLFNILAEDDTSAALDSINGKLGAMGTAMEALAAFEVFKGVADQVGALISDGEAAQQTINATQAALASTGDVAGLTLSGIQELADSVGESVGVVGSDMQAAFNKALTSVPLQQAFASGAVSAKQFMESISDLASVQNGGTVTADGLNSASQLLAKALSFPATAATALKKAHVDLTAAQIAAIAADVKANDILGAQQVIMQAVTTAVGGQAAATVTGSAKMSAAFGTLKEQLGLALLPAATAVMVALTGLITFMQTHSTIIEAVATFVGILAAALVGYKIATIAATIATTGLDTAMVILATVNPFEIAIVAVALLAAGFVYAYQKSADFRAAIGVLKAVIVDAFDWVKDHWPLVLGILLGPVATAAVLIVTHFNTIKNGIIDAFNAIRNAWNSSGVGSILNTLIGAASKVGSIASTVISKIPGLAAGGTVTKSGVTMVGENGPELLTLPGGAVVTPLAGTGGGAFGSYGGGGHVTIDFTGLSQDLLVQTLRKAIRVRGGSVQSVLGGGS